MTNQPTCSRVVRVRVVDQPHVHMLEGTVVSDMVLLKSLGVKNRNLQASHHRDSPQHDLITPEVSPQEIVEVISVAEGTSMECIWICNTVGSSQCGVHIHKHLLPVLYHPVHHLAMEVPGGVVRQVPIAISGTHNPTVTNLDALLYGREQAIAIAFNLKMERTNSKQILTLF